MEDKTRTRRAGASAKSKSPSLNYNVLTSRTPLVVPPEKQDSRGGE